MIRLIGFIVSKNISFRNYLSLGLIQTTTASSLFWSMYCSSIDESDWALQQNVPATHNKIMIISCLFVFTAIGIMFFTLQKYKEILIYMLNILFLTFLFKFQIIQTHPPYAGPFPAAKVRTLFLFLTDSHRN